MCLPEIHRGPGEALPHRPPPSGDRAPLQKLPPRPSRAAPAAPPPRYPRAAGRLRGPLAPPVGGRSRGRARRLPAAAPAPGESGEGGKRRGYLHLSLGTGRPSPPRRNAPTYPPSLRRRLGERPPAESPQACEPSSPAPREEAAGA